MFKRMMFLMLMVVSIGLLAACQTAQPASMPTPGATSAATSALAIREAQIERIDIQVVESSPRQITVITHGQLTEACAQLSDDVGQRYEPTEFQIAVFTTSPTDRGCQQVTTPFDKVIPLTFTDLSAGTYTVVVNGVRGSFTIAGSATPTLPAPATAAPTAAAPTVSVPTATSTPIPPTAAPPTLTPPSSTACTYRAAFLGDVSFPDNTITAPGSVMLKTWRLRNDGNCAWGPGQSVQSLAFVNGSPMGAPSAVALPTYTAPGGVVDVSVNLIAPQMPGTYRSEWMLMVAQGPLFGVGPNYQTPLYAQIQVQQGIPEPACVYRAKFLGDVSVPDNSPSAPNAPFNKIWSVRNDSTCAWGPGTAMRSLIFIGGTSMNLQARVEVPYAQPGQSFELLVPLMSPSLPGTYRAEWKFKADTGELFGVGPDGQAALYVQIVVPNNAPCTYRATFLGDVTIPDNTPLSPGQAFRKTWRLRNDGTCAWGANARVHSVTNVNNNPFGAPVVIAMPDVPPGGTVDLSIDMVAPGGFGLQRSEWMFMVNEGGLRGVGAQGETPLYVQIYVTP
ncbi:hypothetical protein GPROT1_03703 [Gammaproteobacteria bacterium]|nr:hypothetical protein GPROT1_03703 [Gammaproteobacteria bacterium]